MHIYKYIRYFISACLFLVISCRTFYQHGQSDAEYDVQENIFKICRYGDPIQYEDEIEQIFKIQYNISWIRFPEENLSEEVKDHCDGYNKVMEKEIKQIYGEDIFNHVTNAAADLRAHRNKPVSLDID